VKDRGCKCKLGASIATNKVESNVRAKNDPSTNALFHDALLDDTAKLGIVRARFEGFDMSSFDELVTGYSSMKVLTYSSSTSIINRAAEGLERLEIVFGRPDILGEMAPYLHFQELLLKELIEATRGKDFIKEKIESGAIKLHVVQDIISHEKLFLLEGEAGTRVITGSANFSDRAFSGVQNESYVCFDDDPAAWEHFNGAYERIRTGPPRASSSGPRSMASSTPPIFQPSPRQRRARSRPG
jgi:phosphatidylserine/phosphatidylglycerophosphate/cardiolipin synthase-like enzyme